MEEQAADQREGHVLQTPGPPRARASRADAVNWCWWHVPAPAKGH